MHIFIYTGRYALYTSVTHIRYAKPVMHFIRRPLRSYTVTHFIPDHIHSFLHYTRPCSRVWKMGLKPP